MVTVQNVVEILNEAIKLDKEAMTQLCTNRVKCNQALAGHPTIQVRGTVDKQYEVGLIGILVGILSEGGEPKIFMVTDDSTGELVRFEEAK